MRLIKFRGLNVRSNQWEYFTLPEITVAGARNDFFYLKHWSEWTGLLDKNGKEIYSGDILRSPYYNKEFLHHVIEWSDKYCGWFARNAKAKHDRDGSIQLWVYMRYFDRCEVVGNVHEPAEEK